MGFALDAFRNSFLPIEDITIAEWADRYRVISSGASEAGKWRTSRTPYLKEIMEVLSPQSKVKKCVVIKGTQLGFTELGNNVVGYYIHIDPRSIGVWLPSESMVERHAKKKLWRMIEDTRSLKVAVYPRTKGKNIEASTLTNVIFKGGALSLYGSNQQTSYRSDSISVIIKDDVDGFTKDVEGEGSPMELIDNRADSFYNRKIYTNSTPTIHGDSHIELEFENSTQSEYYMPCPECTPKDRELQNKSNMVTFSFNQFNYESEDYKLISDVEFCCPHCGSLLKESNKIYMMDYENGARYIEKYNHDIKGFKVNSFYSPLGWVSWSDIIQEYLKAKKAESRGNKTLIKRFINTRLAETFKEDIEITPTQELEKLVSNMNENEVHTDTWKIVISVDVQGDSFWYELRGLLYGFNTHIMSCGNLGTWEELEYLIYSNFYDTNGDAFKISMCAIDSGYRKQEVYDFCRKNKNVCIPIKGKATMEQSYIRRVQEKEIKPIELYTINTNIFKDSFDLLLKNGLHEEAQNERISFYSSITQPILKQYVSEHRTANGKWQKHHRDNHLFDCATYNTFLSYFLDHRNQKRRDSSKKRKKRGRTISKGIYERNDWLQNY